jgi:hypothetical protein
MIRPFALSLALVAGYASAAAATELVVVSAHGLRLTPGQSIDGSQSIKLEDSQVKGGATDAASAVTALLTERQARTSEVGVVRGENEVKLPDPWVVDVTHPGTSCVIPGHSVVLWRSEDLTATQVSLAPADRSWSVSGSWPAASDRLSMPETLPLKDRTSYVINVGGKLAPVTVRVIPATVGNDVMRASWMAEVGCDSQANALLSMLKK